MIISKMTAQKLWKERYGESTIVTSSVCITMRMESGSIPGKQTEKTSFADGIFTILIPKAMAAKTQKGIWRALTLSLTKLPETKAPIGLTERNTR